MSFFTNYSMTDTNYYMYMMSDTEIVTLHSFKEILGDEIDPISIVPNLENRGHLSKSVHRHVIGMSNNGSNKREITEFLISHLPEVMSLRAFIDVLFQSGYSIIASKLFIACIKQNSTSPARVYKTTSAQRSVLRSYYSQLKILVNNATFANPRLALQYLAKRFVKQLPKTTNPIKRQFLADKCMAVLGAEIDTISITYDNNLYQHEIFEEVKALIPETSNTLLSDIMYYGRLANAHSIAGRFNDSENILAAARSRAYHTGSCLELVNMFYIEVYVKLWEFEKNPSQEIRQSLLMWGRLGLQSIEEEETETRVKWRRNFVLRMAACLIGLGNRATPIAGCTFDETYKLEAGKLLSDVDKHWQGIETRREMFYYVARARLCELKDELLLCLMYLKRAMSLAVEGHFEERKYIAEYQKTVVLQHFLSLIDSQSSRDDYINFVLTKSQNRLNRLHTVEIMEQNEDKPNAELVNSGIPLDTEDQTIPKQVWLNEHSRSLTEPANSSNSLDKTT